MDAPERVLLIRPSALGDVCRTVPVLASLRAAWPDARIDWLVRAGFEDAISAHPALSGVLTFERSRMGLGRWATGDAPGRFLTLARRLREPRYDLVIDAQGLLRSAIFAALTGARRRVGEASARELAWLLYTRRVPVEAHTHAVDRMLALIDPLVPIVADMRLYTRSEWRRRAASLAGDEPAVVIAPTSAWPGKRWPERRYQQIVRTLLDEGRTNRVVMVGGPNEREQCAGLIALSGSEPRLVDLVGRTSVGELMAIIERSSLVIANDSAALHMAVGFDRPLVGVFGPTAVDRVGPFRRNADVIRPERAVERNMHKSDALGRRLLNTVTPEAVLRMAQERLARRNPPAPSPK